MNEFLKISALSGSLALLGGCSASIDAQQGDASRGDTQMQVDSDGADTATDAGSDSGMGSDVVRNGIRLVLIPAAERSLGDRVVGMVAVVRDGMDMVMTGRRIRVWMEGGDGHLGNGNVESFSKFTDMQEVCFATPPTHRVRTVGHVQLPEDIRSEIGRFALATSGNCEPGYSPSGFYFALLQTPHDPEREQVQDVRAEMRGASENIGDTAQVITVLSDPVAPYDLTQVETVPASREIRVGDYSTTVIFPRVATGFNLPCMPALGTSGAETPEGAGCTVAQNGGVAAPRSQSITINESAPESGTAGSIRVNPNEITAGFVVARGLSRGGMLSFYHLGGGTYILAAQAGSTPDRLEYTIEAFGSDGNQSKTRLKQTNIRE